MVGHRSAGVWSDWAVAVLLSPLDQILRPQGQRLLGQFHHLHQFLGAGTNVDGVWGLWGRSTRFTCIENFWVSFFMIYELQKTRYVSGIYFNFLYRLALSVKCESCQWGNERVIAWGKVFSFLQIFPSYPVEHNVKLTCSHRYFPHVQVSWASRRRPCPLTKWTIAFTRLSYCTNSWDFSKSSLLKLYILIPYKLSLVRSLSGVI